MRGFAFRCHRSGYAHRGEIVALCTVYTRYSLLPKYRAAKSPKPGIS